MTTLQTTNFDKADLFKLLTTINDSTRVKLEATRLKDQVPPETPARSVCHRPLPSEADFLGSVGEQRSHAGLLIRQMQLAHLACLRPLDSVASCCAVGSSPPARDDQGDYVGSCRRIDRAHNSPTNERDSA